MTLPASGSISMSQVNTELGLGSTNTIELNNSSVRGIFGRSSGAISMSDGYGKGIINNSTAMYNWIANPANSSVTVQSQADSSILTFPIVRTYGSKGGIYLGQFTQAQTLHVERYDNENQPDYYGEGAANSFPPATFANLKHVAQLFSYYAGGTPKFYIQGVKGQSEQDWDFYWFYNIAGYLPTTGNTTMFSGTVNNGLSVINIPSMPATASWVNYMYQAFQTDPSLNAGNGFTGGAVVNMYIAW